jgi:hypothetical protein
MPRGDEQRTEEDRRRQERDNRLEPGDDVIHLDMVTPP